MKHGFVSKLRVRWGELALDRIEGESLSGEIDEVNCRHKFGDSVEPSLVHLLRGINLRCFFQTFKAYSFDDDFLLTLVTSETS